MTLFPITIENYDNIKVVRDDLLPGGTKSIIAYDIIKKNKDIDEFVYASPVYGGFQIALSIYCKNLGKKATIFCAKHNIKHKNTLLCKKYGAKIVEIFPGYLNVIQKRANDYCNLSNNRMLINFGAYSDRALELIEKRVSSVLKSIKKEPDEIWVAVGSGTLITGILNATKTTKIYGIQVGADFNIDNKRVTILKYPKPFQYESKFETPFPSMSNYDRKAFELLIKNRENSEKNILFWNVMG